MYTSRVGFDRKAGILLCLLFSGCGETGDDRRPLHLPEQLSTLHVTDQSSVGGQALALWDDGGACQLQVGKGQRGGVFKVSAPCYFVKSPGTQRVQVYQHDKFTQVVAVLGTPTQQKRCGQAVQGIVVKGGEVKVSAHVTVAGVYCADQGLDNAQYSLFVKQ